MYRVRLLALILASAAVLCVVTFRQAQTQGPLRRITNTTNEGINTNPSISGDGRFVSFESTEDIAGAGGAEHFRAIRGNISVDPPSFFQMTAARAVPAGVSQDGSRVAFAAKDDPLGSNADGNNEIFLFNGSNLVQITNTSPGDMSLRIVNGNFQPSISDDGRYIAFSSNRNITGQNADANLEIFVYDSSSSTFSQLTNTTGMIGSSDAKISGNGAKVAFIRDSGTTASARRDLMIQDRVSGLATVIASQVLTLTMTYGRAISDDGLRVVYSGETATNSSQVFFYDGRSGNINRQVTSLGVRVTEIPLHPTMSGDGKRIAFATRRAVTGFSNSDASVELYTYDIPTTSFARVTSAPGEADCFDGSNAACEIVSSLNDDGSVVVFNFPRALSGTVTSGLENKSEIYSTGTATNPPFGSLTVLNHASFGHEPNPVKGVAPNSNAVALGTALANTTLQAAKLGNGTFPTNVAGTTVTVNGRSSQIFFVSPTQVQFLVPPQTEVGAPAEVIVTNADGFQSKGNVQIFNAAPGIFTKSGDGLGQGMILNSDTLTEGPFDPSSGNLRLLIFTTGARNAIETTINIGGRVVAAQSVIPSPDMPGLDEVRVLVPIDLRGAGTVNLSIQSDFLTSNPVTVTFTGDPNRNVQINEVLADPPDGIAGDANHDGTRDGTDDEFIEFVNATANENINMGGWTIKTRPIGSSTETTRFTFAAGTSLPAGEAVIVFGGGTSSFNPSDNIFGCAQVFRATSSSGLSLTNSGLTILVRDANGNQITTFTYGGASGLEGDNNQSLTRSPDVTGAFVQHTAAAGASGRRFSPGLRTDGTPFGSCPPRLTSVTLAPLSATISVGQTQQFTAQAFDQFGRVMKNVTISFNSDNTDNPNVVSIDSVVMDSSTGIATATVSGKNPGTAHLIATAINGSVSVNSSQATLTVSGPSLSINDVTQNEGNEESSVFTFTVSLSAPASVPVTFDIATQDNTATVADNDYVPRNLTGQTIPAGMQTYTFQVTINPDGNIEPNETFFVNVTNVSGASVSDGQGIGTIVTDDSPLLSINDVSISEGNSGTTTFTFTVSATKPAPAPGITFDIATADGTAQDDNPVSEDNDYVARSLTGQTIATGLQTYTFDVTVNGDLLVEPNETFFVNITNVSSNAVLGDGQGQGTIQNDDASQVNISQIYGGGGNSGATYRNDFVELFNRGTTSVDITGWTIQQASATGTSWSVTGLCPSGPCVIAPGKYFLVQMASGGAVGANLPTADATGTSNLSVTAGKIALVNNAVTLSGNGCPFGSSIVDFVGYGTTADCSENNTDAPAHSNTTADFRKSGGCIDTNDNAADFLTSTPNPRNSSSPANDCSTGFRPDITINDVSVTEGNSGTKTVDFTVSLSAANPTQTVTVNFATADGSASSSSDYQANSGLVSFSPGQTSQPVTITINGDTSLESNETFFVNLSNPTNAAILDGQGQGTILEDDSPPTLTIADVSQNEGNASTTTFTFTVHLSAPALTGGVTFDIATADGTAQDGGVSEDTDYVGQSLTSQTIPAGSQDYLFNVTVNGDLSIEPNETFSVNVSNVTGATVGDGTAVGTIQNDDSPVLNVNDLSMSEGGAETTTTFTFTVTSTLPAPAGGITFDIATQDGTAHDDNPVSEDNDYVAGSATGLTIPAGMTTATFNVTVNGDTLVEPNETFFVNVTNATNATINDGTGQGTIQNDDSAQLVISQIYGGGNNAGAPFQNDFIEIYNRGTTTVDFSLTPYSVQYAGVGSNFGSSKTNLTTGTILPGKYYLVQESGGTTNGVPLPAADATGTISLGSTSGKVALVVGTTALGSFTCPGDDGSTPFNPSDGTIADFIGYGSTAATAGHCYEGTGPTAATSNTTAAFRKGGGCVDTNDNAADSFVYTPVPRNSSTAANTCSGQTTDIVINDVTVTEGDGGTVSANFTVTLTSPSASTVTVDYATANNTAVAPGDYNAITTTQLSFSPGTTSLPVSVTVNGDTLDEPDETFFVNLSNASNATILDSQGVGTITDNDVPPALTINDVSQNEGASGPTTFTFTVHLAAPALTGGVTFDIATADGTAQDGDMSGEDFDYVAKSLLAQTIPAGSQDYIFTVTVNGDSTNEPNETFFVNVTNVTGATVSDGAGQGTIQNDDSPTLSINDVTQTEGDSGTTTFTFTVTSSLPAPAGGITFDIATADGTAQDDNPVSEDNDYVAKSLTAQTIPAGMTTYLFTVDVNGDTKNESICETFLVNITNATNASILDGQGQGGITDNDGTKVVISQVYGGGNNSGAPYRNDFIEIFNRGNVAVSLNGWSVQYSSDTGTTWSVTNLTNVSLQPGQYYLVQEAGGVTNGVALPTPDATGTIAMAAGAGKVALVNSTTALTGSCPASATILDLVGYGTTASCFEGSGRAPAPSNTTSDSRANGGCTDTGNNNTDFAAGAPNPRNTLSTLAPCSCSSSYSSFFFPGLDSLNGLLAQIFKSGERPVY